MNETGNYIFIGNDSLGYKNNEVYLLTLEVGGEYPISIRYPEYCPYDSLKAFLHNWKLV